MKKNLLTAIILGLSTLAQAQLFQIDPNAEAELQVESNEATLEIKVNKTEESIDDLSFEEYLEKTRDLQGDFTQTVYSNATREISHGKMWVSKPGKFYWDYQSPMAQKIISNGRKVWQYDLDLEQIAVRGRDELVGDVAMDILTGTRRVDEVFSVIQIETAAQMPDILNTYAQNAVVYRLTPLNVQDGYDNVWIVMKNNALYAINVDVGRGQQTVLTFSNLNRNAGISAEQFEFTPPVGVDIVGE